MMAIEGLLTRESGQDVEVIGFTGTDLECEGCGAKTDELIETDDSVFLCAACYRDCLDDPDCQDAVDSEVE